MELSEGECGSGGVQRGAVARHALARRRLLVLAFLLARRRWKLNTRNRRRPHDRRRSLALARRRQKLYARNGGR